MDTKCCKTQGTWTWRKIHGDRKCHKGYRNSKMLVFKTNKNNGTAMDDVTLFIDEDWSRACFKLRLGGADAFAIYRTSSHICGSLDVSNTFAWQLVQWSIAIKEQYIFKRGRRSYCHCAWYQQHTSNHSNIEAKNTQNAHRIALPKYIICLQPFCVRYDVYASGPKTVLIKCTFLLACVRRSWMGGAGGHVNVSCTSSATCWYAAPMSGSVASLYTLSNWSAVLEGGHMGC